MQEHRVDKAAPTSDDMLDQIEAEASFAEVVEVLEVVFNVVRVEA